MSETVTKLGKFPVPKCDRPGCEQDAYYLYFLEKRFGCKDHKPIIPEPPK